jgi:serine/threonine protein kinase
MSSSRYLPLRSLGTGSTSSATLCLDASTSRLVAVKTIPFPYPESHFSHELSINNEVICDQIIKLFGYFVTDTSFCLVFEPGRCDLFSRIESEGPLTEAEAKNAFFDVLTAIAHLHERNVVHRDIKLENLICVETGAVKLADFGLAEIVNPGGKLKSRKGFYRYWPPEVILGKPYDAKVDIWGIGVCLFAAVTGEFPFVGDDEYEYTMDVL